jgi:putative transposase
VIYTTNAIESVNMSLRKITKNRGSFPNDDAPLKLFYLAINNISKKWTMPIPSILTHRRHPILQITPRLHLSKTTRGA